jgi:hypothetical protein
MQRGLTIPLRRFFLITAILVIIVASLSSWSCSPGTDSEPVESIRLGTVLLEPSVPIFVAQERNFFWENKLDG